MLPKTIKRLGRSDFVYQMAVDIEQNASVGQLRYHVLIPNFVEKRLRHTQIVIKIVAILLKVMPSFLALLIAPAIVFSGVQSPDAERLKGSSRKDEAGWVQITLKGEPRNIGYQLGYLGSAEILDAHTVVRSSVKGSTGKDWNWFRAEAQRMFWDKLDKEYQDEIDGQVEGLKAKNVNLDRWDVLAYNSHIELEGYYWPWLNDKASTKESCSAFVATGKATKDGKPVIGHNMWWDYLVGQRFNFALDIQPTKGYRVVMDALPGFIHSGTDFAITSAGLMICETTIPGFFGFDPEGIPEFVRMRKATQYAEDLDEWVEIMKKGNNGGYANTWLIADLNSNEIGKLELGLKNVVLTRSKDGYFVGANFCEDPKLTAEETRGWNPDPKRNGSLRRKARWESLLTKNTGLVDDLLGRAFLSDTYDEVLDRKGASGSTLCGRGAFGGAVNAKVANAELGRKLSYWGRMGCTDGTPITFNSSRPAGLKDMPSMPWLLIENK